MKQGKGKHQPNGEKGKRVTSVGVNTLAYVGALRAMFWVWEYGSQGRQFSKGHMEELGQYSETRNRH